MIERPSVQQALPLTDERRPAKPQGLDGKICLNCGGLMQRTGACHTCTSCGDSDGCG